MSEDDYILVATLTRLRSAEDALRHCMPHDGCPVWTEAIEQDVARKVAAARRWFEQQVASASEDRSVQ